MRRAVAFLALVGLAATGCASSTSSSAPAPQTAAQWRVVPAPPLTPRSGAVTVSLGGRAYLLGGDPSQPCPANASCDKGDQPTRDAVAFEPVGAVWKTLASAPEGIRAYSPHAVVGSEIYLWGVRRLLSYDTVRDVWGVHPAHGLAGADLAAFGTHVVAVQGERQSSDPAGYEYDPVSHSWRALPDDRLGATFDRGVIATPAGLLLTGHELVPNPGSAKPSVVRAELYDGMQRTWRLLPDSDQLGGGGWITFGGRLIGPTLGGADGGEVNGYGRTVPFGGTLDPARGVWGRLPEPPQERGGGWPANALGDAIAAVGGWVFEAPSSSWLRLAKPSGAPEQPGDAVWVGRQLLVVGGIDGHSQRQSGAWLLTLPR